MYVTSQDHWLCARVWTLLSESKMDWDVVGRGRWIAGRGSKVGGRVVGKEGGWVGDMRWWWWEGSEWIPSDAPSPLRLDGCPPPLPQGPSESLR